MRLLSTFSKMGFLGLAAASALSGCVDDGGQASLVVLGATPLAAGACAAPSSSGQYTPSGVLDISFENTAVDQPAVILNQMSNDVDGDNIPTNEIRLKEQQTIISFVAANSSDLPTFEYTIPIASISVAPGATQGLFLRIPITIIDEIRANVSAQYGEGGVVPMLMTSKIVGIRSGTGTGTEVESREFTFPIDMCFGCLRSCNSTVLSVDDGMGGTNDVELCTADNCLSGPRADGGYCGNAYGLGVTPVCCSGEAEGLTEEICLGA